MLEIQLGKGVCGKAACQKLEEGYYDGKGNLCTPPYLLRSIPDKALHSLDRYGEMVKGYPYVEPFDDETFAYLADESNERNIPNTLPQSDFDRNDYEKYLKELRRK